MRVDFEVAIASTDSGAIVAMSERVSTQSRTFVTFIQASAAELGVLDSVSSLTVQANDISTFQAQAKVLPQTYNAMAVLPAADIPTYAPTPTMPAADIPTYAPTPTPAPEPAAGLGSDWALAPIMGGAAAVSFKCSLRMCSWDCPALPLFLPLFPTVVVCSHRNIDVLEALPIPTHCKWVCDPTQVHSPVLT